jgi:outer membrane protein TolC
MKILRPSLVLVLLTGKFLAVGMAVEGLVLAENVLPQLEPVLTAAVQQSPSMLNRALDLEIAENNRIQSRAGLLPSLGGYANYMKSRDTRADLSGRLEVTKVAYNFSITQPVYHWGERRNLLKISEIQASIIQGQYRDGYRALAQILRNDYMRLIVQKLVVKRGAAYADFTKNQLAKEEIRLAQKVIADFQIVPVRLAAEQAQLAYERAQFDLEMAKLSFARLSGLPPLADSEIPDSIPSVSYDAGVYDRLLAGFLSQKELPAIEAVTMRKQLETGSLSLANQKTRLRPKFSFVLGVSQDEQSYTVNVAQKYRVNSVFAGLSANWTIFDGLAAQAAVRNDLARLRQMRTDYKVLNDRLAQQAQTNVRLINFSARNMSITDRSRLSAESNLESTQENFKRGVNSEDDVSLARITVYDAQISAASGRSDFLNRVGDFLGTIMADPVLDHVALTK